MIWILDETATWAWVLANTAIALSYLTSLSHMLPKIAGLDETMAMRMKAFIYSCGCGHIAMVGFMAILMQEVWAWRLVVAWDMFTAYVSVEFAIMVWRAYRKTHPHDERDSHDTTPAGSN